MSLHFHVNRAKNHQQSDKELNEVESSKEVIKANSTLPRVADCIIVAADKKYQFGGKEYCI
jgi:hypothetical protein